MKIELKRIDISYVDELQTVFEMAPNYTLKVDGISTVPEDSAKSAIKALPPDIDYKNKYVFLIKYKDEFIGAVDLIKGYPAKDTAYIGLLLLSENMQGRGLGEASYKVIEKYILNNFQITKIQLSYVESNPVIKFWEKQGFYKIGDRKPYKGVNNRSFSQKMEKELMLFLEPEEYQEKVHSIFLRVKEDLKEKIDITRFEHIGASSIKGLVSKGDLDIFLGVDKDRFEQEISNLKDSGYYEKQDTLRNDELCMMVTDKYRYDVAIQVVVNGSKFENFLKFRDLLNNRDDLVEELNALKRRCHGMTPLEYRLSKSKWIENVINTHIC